MCLWCRLGRPSAMSDARHTCGPKRRFSCICHRDGVWITSHTPWPDPDRRRHASRQHQGVGRLGSGTVCGRFKILHGSSVWDTEDTGRHGDGVCPVWSGQPASQAGLQQSFPGVGTQLKVFRLQVGDREEVISADCLKPHTGSTPAHPTAPPCRGQPPKL